MIHCLFEQSGTFKNEFIKLGMQAKDYDIRNDFGQTDVVIDLFAEIEKGYDSLANEGGGKTIYSRQWGKTIWSLLSFLALGLKLGIT